TGKKFGYEHYDVEPDIFTLAKGLGNGIPVGAMVAKDKYGNDFGPGAHGSTFGGNPVAMAAAKAVTSIVFEPSFLQEVEEKAAYLATLLQDNLPTLKNVKNVRQKGLMVGIECDKPVISIVQ